jgi:proline iminopeptidase
MSILKWLSFGIAGLIALVVILFVAMRGDYAVAALVTEDGTLPSREIADLRLHMRTLEGPPGAQTIVVLHGGAGLSERVPAELLTLDGYLVELDAIIELTSPDRPVVLIGHSWGAMLATSYLGAHPDRVARAVLIEPGYLDADGKVAWDARAADLMSGAGYALNAVLNGFRAAHVTGPDEQASDDFLIGQMVEVFASHPENPYHCGNGYTAPIWRFGSLASALWRDTLDTELDLIARGTEFPGPVLFMAGGCNDWTGAPLQRRHMALFADSRLEVIPDAGHDVVWDNPGAAMPVIRAFLSEDI